MRAIILFATLGLAMPAAADNCDDLRRASAAIEANFTLLYAHSTLALNKPALVSASTTLIEYGKLLGGFVRTVIANIYASADERRRVVIAGAYSRFLLVTPDTSRKWYEPQVATKKLTDTVLSAGCPLRAPE